MRLSSREIPQADRLDTVVDVVAAVGSGATSYQDIAHSIGKVERQGRYYRLAAELLGFLKPVSSNTYVLTSIGNQFLESAEEEREQILAARVLDSVMFQRIIPYLEAYGDTGCTRSDIRNFIESVTQKAGPSMIPRRTSTAISWLSRIGVLAEISDRFYIKKLPNHINLIKYVDTEPLLPSMFDLHEYRVPQTRSSSSGFDIVSIIDAALRERANNTHQALVNDVANKLKSIGAIPRNNSYVDLAALVNGKPYIFEMKSCTADNMRDQIRKGISQLYEYRYLQAATNANLVLVIEKPLIHELSWMKDYLTKDRGIILAWDGNGKTYHCSPQQKSELSFLVSDN